MDSLILMECYGIQGLPQKKIQWLSANKSTRLIGRNIRTHYKSQKSFCGFDIFTGALERQGWDKRYILYLPQVESEDHLRVFQVLGRSRRGAGRKWNNRGNASHTKAVFDTNTWVRKEGSEMNENLLLY